MAVSKQKNKISKANNKANKENIAKVATKKNPLKASKDSPGNSEKSKVANKKTAGKLFEDDENEDPKMIIEEIAKKGSKKSKKEQQAQVVEDDEGVGEDADNSWDIVEAENDENDSDVGMMDDAFGSDEDDHDSDSDSDADDGDIEKQTKRLDRKKAKIAAQGAAELSQNLTGGENFALPTVEEVVEETKTAPNLNQIKDRISDVMQVLGDFAKRREEGKSRSDYLEVLIKDLCSYYGYNEYLMEKFMKLFPIGNEFLEFLDANDVVRPVTIRTNTLKTRRKDLAKSLINRGMNVDPAAEWSKVGLVVYDSQVPVGATPEYLAGHYMIQGLNSLLPVIALDPQPGDRVLDMCAAPGGKTSHIAALMKNQGTLFANDANHQRCKAIIGNLHRLGVNNAVISNVEAQEFAKISVYGFDRVLLDAPCSGTGVIWKDQSVKTSKDSQDIQQKHTRQRELILSALDALDANSANGGYLVYSTCSVLVEENEAVVNYALEKRHCKLVPTGLEVGVDGFTKYGQYRFHPSLNLTKRYYPHIHNIDGFFVAKIKKLSNTQYGKITVGIVAAEKAEENKKRKEALKAAKDAKALSQATTKAAILARKQKSKDDDDDDDGDAGVKNKKRRTQRRKNKKRYLEKLAKSLVDDGFNTVGNLPKPKKKTVDKIKIGKRATARSSAKMIKRKRRKLMEAAGSK